jgi:hypothetical protein
MGVQVSDINYFHEFLRLCDLLVFVFLMILVENASEVPPVISPTEALHFMNENIPFQQAAATLDDRENEQGKGEKIKTNKYLGSRD